MAESRGSLTRWWQVQEKNYCSFFIFVVPCMMLVLERLIKDSSIRQGIKSALSKDKAVHLFLSANVELLSIKAPIWLFLFAVPVNLWIRQKSSGQKVMSLVKVGMLFALIDALIMSRFGLIAMPFIYMEYVVVVSILAACCPLLKGMGRVVNDRIEEKTT